jgi:lysine 2,3-aminomutase
MIKYSLLCTETVNFNMKPDTLTTDSTSTRQQSVLDQIGDHYHYSEEIARAIETENLLPIGLINRLHKCYPQHSGFFSDSKILFTGKTYFSGLDGFREIIHILESNGIDIGFIKEREFFIEVYRFLATRHALNMIDWSNYQKNSIFQLVFPQPEMIRKEEVQKYKDAKTDAERKRVVEEYQRKTNPHDGKQKLNKPFFINEEGQMEILQGVQHKYPPVELIFDTSTQNCFAFCTYCFRHAQVRGDEDMFVQNDISQVHEYLKEHKEVSDILITGGDAGFISPERMEHYVLPIIEDPELLHIRTIRFGSRVLTFHPEYLLTPKYKRMMELLGKAVDNGVQVVWVSHFSTPREVLNPSTIAAARRLKNHGIAVKSQSPIMNHISLFQDKDGNFDIDKSAQNWIDLGNIFAMLGIGFHSMYCARPTGEHHYFTAPLAIINQVFSKVYRSLASINRPSRYITMTSSGGKTSLIGTAEINGETYFALKFNEARNMEWMDKVFLAKYDEKENTIEKLQPFEGDKHFYENELYDIERKLEEAFIRETQKTGK